MIQIKDVLEIFLAVFRKEPHQRWRQRQLNSTYQPQIWSQQTTEFKERYKGNVLVSREAKNATLDLIKMDHNSAQTLLAQFEIFSQPTKIQPWFPVVVLFGPNNLSDIWLFIASSFDDIGRHTDRVYILLCKYKY